jgi:hypothetical protein
MRGRVHGGVRWVSMLQNIGSRIDAVLVSKGEAEVETADVEVHRRA